MAGRMCSKRTMQGVRTPIVEAWEKVVQAGEGEGARRGRGEGLDSWQGSEEVFFLARKPENFTKCKSGLILNILTLF